MARMGLKAAARQFAKVDRSPAGDFDIEGLIRQSKPLIRELVSDVLDESGGNEGGCDCEGGGERGAFGAYAPAGLIKIRSTGASSKVDGTISITGDSLPADSIILIVSYRSAAGVALPRDTLIVTNIKADNKPAPVGDNGIAGSILDISEFNAPGSAVMMSAKNKLLVEVQFPGTSAANDEVWIAVLSRGQMSTKAEMCQA